MQEMSQATLQYSQRTKRCRFCGEEILVAAVKCKHCGEYLSPAARRAAGLQPVRAQQPTVGQVRAPFGSAVLGMLLCLPVGLIALIFAAQVNTKIAVGDIAGARAAADTAQKLAFLADVLGLVLFLLMVTIS